MNYLKEVLNNKIFANKIVQIQIKRLEDKKTSFGNNVEKCQDKLRELNDNTKAAKEEIEAQKKNVL